MLPVWDAAATGWEVLRRLRHSYLMRRHSIESEGQGRMEMLKSTVVLPAAVTILIVILVACSENAPTPAPSATNSPASPPTNTPVPTNTPTPVSTATPTPAPTNTPTPVPTNTPTPVSTATPTPAPTNTPTPVPTNTLHRSRPPPVSPNSISILRATRFGKKCSILSASLSSHASEAHSATSWSRRCDGSSLTRRSGRFRYSHVSSLKPPAQYSSPHG